MKKAVLIQACENLIKKFDPKKMTLDSHAAEELGDCESANADPGSVFVKQVFYGVVRNKQALKVFMSQFYNDMAASVLRADYTRYLILAYLTIFRLQEITFPEYRKFIESQEPDKMGVFLSYIFDIERLTNSVKWDWLKIFDLEFVEEHMLLPLSKHAHTAEKMRIEMIAKASGLAAEKEASEGRVGIPELPKKQLTKPRSPNLTRPAPRHVQQPERISQEIVAKPVPNYNQRTQLSQVESDKEDRRQMELHKTIKKYETAKEQPFQFHETRNTIRETRKEYENKEANQLMFEMPPRQHQTKNKGDKDGGKPKSAPAEFRMNTASYLREEALYKKKQAQDAKVIQSYESELRDATEFYSWQTSMREQDLQGRKEQVERVRMLAKQSADEAKEAILKQKSDNYEVASLVKLESKEMQKQLELESEMTQLMNKQLVREVISVRENAPKEAQSRMFIQRKERHNELKDELSLLLSNKEEEDRILLKEREERVKKLKAENEVHELFIKEFDPTESIGIGLLDEMSLLEMKERLEINKLRDKENNENKRSSIVNQKQKQSESLRKRIENIERIRSKTSESSKEFRNKKKLKEEQEAIKTKEIRNMNNLKLLNNLNIKRDHIKKERQWLADEEERMEKIKHFQGGGSGSKEKEELHFLQLLQGSERGAKQRQYENQISSKFYEDTKSKAKNENDKNLKNVINMKKKDNRIIEDEIERKKKELILKEKADAQIKKNAFLEQREKHKNVKDRIAGLNPYAATRTEMSKSKREKLKQSSIQSN